MDSAPDSPAPGPAAKVAVLFRFGGAGDSKHHKAYLPQTVGPFSCDAVVWLSATGSASLKPGEGPRGILLTIRRDSNDVAYDRDAAASPDRTRCHASASHHFVLPKDHKVIVAAETGPIDDRTAFNHETSVRLDIVALAADMQCD